MGLRKVMRERRDLYCSENQLVKALLELAKAAEAEEIQQAFDEHLNETKGQVERLRTESCRQWRHKSPR